jgi:hypothetical protein
MLFAKLITVVAAVAAAAIESAEGYSKGGRCGER